MDAINELLALPIFRNSLADWALALGLTFVLLSALLWARGLVHRYYQKLLATEETELAEVPLEVLSRTTLLFFVVLSVFAGLTTLTMSPITERVLYSALTIARWSDRSP
jgi:hypothetical protein